MRKLEGRLNASGGSGDGERASKMVGWLMGCSMVEALIVMLKGSILDPLEPNHSISFFKEFDRHTLKFRFDLVFGI